MKRSMALALIKWAGWHNDQEKAALLTAQNGIGVAASRKSYIDGQKMKRRGEPCGCDLCQKEKK